jgi:predicted RNA-binding protein YlqC (UPF0109 family)
MKLRDTQTESVEKFYRLLAGNIVEYIPDLNVEAWKKDSVWKKDRGAWPIILLNVTAHAHDYGKLVGSGGRMFRAFDTVLKALGNRMGCRIELKLRDPEVGSVMGLVPFELNPNWKPDDLVKLLQEVANYLFYKKSFIVIGNEDERTHFTIMALPQPNENAGSFAAIANALDDICYAVGKSQGHLVSVNIETRVANHEEMYHSRTGEGTFKTSGR